MSPIEVILAPVDFSEQSRFAVREAASIAARFGARLLLAHAIQPPGDKSHFHGQDALGEREAYAAAELSQMAAREAPEAACEEIVLHGDVAEVIHRIVEERSVDLIVLATHGEGPFRRFLIGSNTAKILHDVGCPVLTGAHMEDAPEACFPYYRIGCLLSLRPGSQRILKDAFDFSRAYRADLTAVHVAPEFRLDSGGETEYEAALRKSARRHLQAVLEEANVEAVPLVASGDLVGRVEELVEKHKLDLIVVGRSGAEGRELRSDAYDLIRSSRCPVLSV